MRVIVGIDESEESFYALEWALDNLFNGVTAEADGGSLLTLLHVRQPYHQYGIPPPGIPGATTTAYYVPTEVMETVRKATEQKCAAVLKRALNMCRDKMMKAETMILEGDAKDMICQAIEQVHVDLLIVGSRGLGKIKRAFLGSVSDYCSHYATCPVLIVKPPKGKDHRESLK